MWLLDSRDTSPFHPPSGGPSGALTDADLEALYDHPGDSPYVRANMVSSLDGAATAADGLSGALGGAGDRRVFGTVRGLADAVVAGVGTVVAEGYSRPVCGPEVAARRLTSGRAPAPTLIVPTSRLDIPDDHPLLLPASGAAAPTVFLTGPDHDRARADALWAVGAEVEVLDAAPRPGDVIVAAVRRGLTRILCEGGPRLLAAFIAADLVDELCLTLSPVLAGGRGPRITDGLPAGITRMTPAHVIADRDGTLYTRWIRHR